MVAYVLHLHTSPKTQFYNGLFTETFILRKTEANQTILSFNIGTCAVRIIYLFKFTYCIFKQFNINIDARIYWKLNNVSAFVTSFKVIVCPLFGYVFVITLSTVTNRKKNTLVCGNESGFLKSSPIIKVIQVLILLIRVVRYINDRLHKYLIEYLNF